MKNRTTAITICLLFVSSLQAQNTRFDFSRLDTMDVDVKYELMDRVKDNFAFWSEMESWPGDFTKYFHFLDLDNDNDPDLIYDGWSGSEPMIARIYLNVEGEYIHAFHQFSDIINMEVENNTLISMHIHNPGCCLEIMEHEYFYEFNMSKDNLDCHLTEHYIYHNETTKPTKYYVSPLRFEILNTTYYLRITPEIDSLSYFYPDDSKGNILNLYSKHDCGIALAEKADKTGRIWWYVIMDNKEERNNYMNDPEYFPPKYIGWMSSRYLKTLIE